MLKMSGTELTPSQECAKDLEILYSQFVEGFKAAKERSAAKKSKAPTQVKSDFFLQFICRNNHK